MQLCISCTIGIFGWQWSLENLRIYHFTFFLRQESWPLFLKVCSANFFISLNRFVQPYHHMYRLFLKHWKHFLLNRLNLLITCITYFLISPQSCSSVSTPGSKSLWAVSFSFASTFSLKQNNAMMVSIKSPILRIHDILPLSIVFVFKIRMASTILWFIVIHNGTTNGHEMAHAWQCFRP